MALHPYGNSLSRLSFRRSKSFNYTNSSMMVRSIVIINELKGNLKVVEKKQRILKGFRVDRSADEDHIKTYIC